MGTLFRFVLLTGLRDKLYLGLLTIILFIFGLSNLVGFSALSEQSQMQLVYFSFLSRVVLVCGLILFICFHIHKSFENKEIDFILAKPISRNKFILSYWLSFNLISLILFIPIILIQLIFNNPNLVGLFWWSISIILEIMLVSTFAIVSSFILKSAVVSVLASISFYFMARMMGFFVYSISVPNNVEEVKSFTGIAESSLKILSAVFPRLDLFAKSEWLVYSVENYHDIYVVLIQSLIYIPLMLFLAFYDFEKKQF
jgi:ABC-type transport system involved in multi-copper enzyme maturation permease subunit